VNKFKIAAISVACALLAACARVNQAIDNVTNPYVVPSEYKGLAIKKAVGLAPDTCFQLAIQVGSHVAQPPNVMWEPCYQEAKKKIKEQEQQAEIEKARQRKAQAEAIHAEKVREAQIAAIRKRLPKGYSFDQHASLEGVIDLLRTGAAKISDVKHHVFELDNPSFKIVQVQKGFCLVRHIFFQYEPILMIKNCPADTIEGSMISSLSKYWAIDGVTYYQTVMGANQQAIEVSPIIMH